MATELAEILAMIETMRAEFDCNLNAHADDVWWALDWLSNNAEAIEVGLRMMALNPGAEVYTFGDQVCLSFVKVFRRELIYGTTLLDALRALDEGDEDGK